MANPRGVNIPEVEPPSWSYRRTKMLSIRLTEDELESLREEARDKGSGISTLVRSLIKDFLKHTA